MITGSGEETRELMIDAAIRIVAEFGFEGFTTKKWASEAGVAEGSLYYHFGNKNDLLDRAFISIDREIAALYDNFSAGEVAADEINGLICELWLRYFHYLVENPEKTKYYYRFRTSPRYTAEIIKEEFSFFGSFIDAASRVNDLTDYRNRLNQNVLWSFIMDSTTGLAYRVITGAVQYNEEVEKEMLILISGGLLGALLKLEAR